MSAKSRESIGLRQRFRILARDGFACRWCGARAAEGAKLVIDHILPVAAGGANNDANLCAACEPCNQGKGKLLLTSVVSFAEWLRMQVGRDDIVGDLADDAVREEGPARVWDFTSYQTLRRWILKRNPSADHDVMRAAWHAWREYRRGGRPTPLVREQRTAVARSIVENKTNNTCYWLKKGVWMSGEFFPHTSGSKQKPKTCSFCGEKMRSGHNRIACATAKGITI